MKLGYTIVYVDNVAATLAFYESAFGFARGFVHASGDYGELVTGETTLAFATIALGQSHFAEPIQPVSLGQPVAGIELAFVTDDVSAAFARACAAGAQPLAPPESKPWGQTVAYVRAQEGTLIELCSPVGAA
jgi:catechol 2,3-dioxygenase-like lactoylglutathione lyase family enzyme